MDKAAGSFSKVTPILGGFEAWKGAGYPVSP